MSLWSSINHLVHGVGAAGAHLLDRGLDAVAGGGEARRAMTFSMAVVALAAKMAKADGIVTTEELQSFWQRFSVADKDRRDVERLFRLAQQDVAGYEKYAAKIARLFPDEPAILEDIVDALLYIAAADGVLHPNESAFLERVAGIFGIDERAYRRLVARHVRDEGTVDAYAVLGVSETDTLEVIRRRYRELVAQNHPDRLLARGVPEDFIKLANDRVAAINEAWEIVRKSHVEARQA